MRRSRRPKYMAEPTTRGTTPRAVSVSRGCIEREQDDSPDQCQNLARELCDLMAEHPLQEADIRGQTTGELAGAPLGEEAGRHLEESGEQLPPKPGDDLLTHGAQKVCLRIVQQSLYAEQHDQPDGNAIENFPVLTHEGRIEHEANDHRKSQAQDRAGRERQRCQRQHATVGPHARPQPCQPPRAGKARLAAPRGLVMSVECFPEKSSVTQVGTGRRGELPIALIENEHLDRGCPVSER